MNSPDLSSPESKAPTDVNHRTHGHGALSSGARLCAAVPKRRHPVTGESVDRPAQGKHRAGLGTMSVAGLARELKRRSLEESPEAVRSRVEDRARLVIVKSLDDVS